jgi:phage tail sheath protein FI
MPLYNGSNTSAGVYGGEEDNAQSSVSTNPSVGAMVGPSRRGPVGVPTLAVDKEDFRKKFGKPDASLTFAHFCAEQFLKTSNQLWFLRVERNALYGSISVRYIDGYAQIKVADQGYADPTNRNIIPEEILFLYASDPGAWNDSIRVVMYPDVNDLLNEQFVLEIYEGNYSVPVEIYYATLRDYVNGNGKQLNIVDQLKAANSRLRAVVNEDNPQWVASDGAQRTINAVISGDLSFGSDGDPVTVSDILDGWDAFEEPEEIEVTLLINAGYTDISVQERMIEIAESRRDCFAILDVPSDMQTSQLATNFRRNILNANTSFAGLYTPDVQIYTEDGQEVWCPPSGVVAEVFANSDAIAAEFWAPAGVIRGAIDAAVLDAAQRYRLGDRNMLDQNQVNFIHNISGYGFVVWAAKTLQSFSSPLSDIPVRRLINLVETRAKYEMMTGVFEPNDPFLWRALKNIVTDILKPIKAKRGLYAYNVKCDADTNPPEQIANGDVALVYYIQPARYGKRILFTTSVAKTGQISTAVEYVVGTN